MKLLTVSFKNFLINEKYWLTTARDWAFYKLYKNVMGHSNSRPLSRVHCSKVVFIVLLWIITGLSTTTAEEYFIDIKKQPVKILSEQQQAIVANGTLPGPTIHWREGEWVNIHVTNYLDEQSSIHWHGILLPYQMDGVPGISFDGIDPGQTFTYHFQVKQSGTYWYHGHSGLQEQQGLYGALIIDPAISVGLAKNDFVIMLSDWPEADPYRTLVRLKKQSDYYNFQKRTAVDFVRDVQRDGFVSTVKDRLAWGDMRMMPSDLADVTGATYHFLVNGKTAEQNWTALFNPSEKVRLRFINASAMTHFDVRIPGLPLRIIESDGVMVEPVEVDEFRIAVAETYDVIVEPQADRAYTIFAEAMDRSGYARATLTANQSLTAPVPKVRSRTLLTMSDMPGKHHHGDAAVPNGRHPDHQGKHKKPAASLIKDGDTAKDGHSGHFGHRKEAKATISSGESALHYQQLKAVVPNQLSSLPDREIILRLTGSMNRYIWSFNDVKYSESEPIRVRFGEHIRFKYINETMMNHPIHLHGLWQYLEAGQGALNPKKHVVNVKPGQTVEVDVLADAVGEWAFHCHLLYHMQTGMFRKFVVEDVPGE